MDKFMDEKLGTILPLSLILLLGAFIAFNFYFFMNNSGGGESTQSYKTEEAVLGVSSTWNPEDPNDLTRKDYLNRLEIGLSEEEQELSELRRTYQSFIDSKTDSDNLNFIKSELKIKIAEQELKIDKITNLQDKYSENETLEINTEDKLFILSVGN
jgi:hypothetical protein